MLNLSEWNIQASFTMIKQILKQVQNDLLIIEA